VGQRIDAFGTATSAGGAVTLDASSGQVRLETTAAWGTVTALGANTVTLSLQSLGGLPPSAFNFAGTGKTTASDATAMSYVVNTGALDLTGLATNSPSRVLGFVTPFGSAPPDFTAETLVNYANVTDELMVTWGRTGSSSAFTGLTTGSTSLQLNLSGVGALHFIGMGPTHLDLTTLSAAPSLVPDTSGSPTAFSIGHAMSFKTETFAKFSDFVSQLAADITGATTVIAVNAAGHYDSTSNTFTASHLIVVLSN
jgi:hypothetical protein